MNDRERKQYHDRANQIARDAWPAIDEKQTQASNIRERPEPIPDGFLRSLSQADKEKKDNLLAEAKQIREKAAAEIEREVIDKLPPSATEKDKQLIRDQAYDILGIPPDQREQGKATDIAKGTSVLPAQSKLSKYLPIEFQIPDVKETPPAKSKLSKYLPKTVGSAGQGRRPATQPDPEPKGPDRDDR